MKVLTVILSDYSSYAIFNEPIKHRTVQIPLTKEQLINITPKITHTCSGKEHYEEISQCYIEEI